ncbi:NAD(P)/FAD-dependent oxidoreductase [Svornostia abyssi]|uniref:NAD(P)/FAD-dependent oxidoreductase n=1 Tax=Svornostia abyssi TaxID=2898438 RepID=A0ABY5PIA5_9ACTN|nr:NAD(P)/FAD-dependent oxidoreductase [Parviterribacteraceae bacterium J379]
MSGPTAVGPRVAIIGAGLSGLAMAMAMQDAGMQGFTIFEKAQDVGGTWRENQYPGLTCDVPGRFYQFHDAPNPDWSHRYAAGWEIHRYIRRVVSDRGLAPHIRFGSEVTEARWEDDHWHLRTSDGDEHTADVVVAATGVLHQPRLPSIDGMATFAGPSFHSARWQHDVPLEGKRIAVVGTGSTSAQIVGALAGTASHIDVYQRSRHWVVEMPNPRYSRLTRALLRRFPRLNMLGYHAHRAVLFDWLAQGVVEPGLARRVFQGIARRNFAKHVQDPELRAQIEPDYPPLCKRLIIAPNYLTALQRPDVDLVTEHIDRIEPEGIRTRDGALHRADVIVYATGFDAAAFMRPMAITGRDGLTLAEAWEDGPRAYRSVALPGFPNLFTLQGPHSPVGNYSLVRIAETQVHFVMEWLRQMRAGEITAVAPREDATDAYYRDLRAAIPNTVWDTGCRSWYHDAEGNVQLWPWTAKRHREMLAHPIPEHFEIERPAVADAALSPSG